MVPARYTIRRSETYRTKETARSLSTTDRDGSFPGERHFALSHGRCSASRIFGPTNELSTYGLANFTSKPRRTPPCSHRRGLLKLKGVPVTRGLRTGEHTSFPTDDHRFRSSDDVRREPTTDLSEIVDVVHFRLSIFETIKSQRERRPARIVSLSNTLPPTTFAIRANS